MGRILNFNKFTRKSLLVEESLLESYAESFDPEDYENFKSYWRKKRNNEDATEKEKNSIAKYYRIKKSGTDPLESYRKNDTIEGFTEEDYSNYKKYSQKTHKGEKDQITPEEREAFNRVARMRRKGLDPLKKYIEKEDDVFTENDYLNVKSFHRKKNTGADMEITPEEKESFRKYARMRRKGENPFSSYKEEILSQGLSQEEKELIRSYSKKMRKGEYSLVTQEERSARSKYQILRNRGII